VPPDAETGWAQADPLGIAAGDHDTVTTRRSPLRRHRAIRAHLRRHPQAESQADSGDRLAGCRGWKGPEGLRREAGALTVLDDVPAEPAPGSRGGLDELVRNGVEDRDLGARQGDDRNPTATPLVASQTRTVLPLSRRVPSGDQAAARTRLIWPVSWWRGCAVVASQTRTVPSCLPVSRRVPSGDYDYSTAPGRDHPPSHRSAQRSTLTALQSARLTAILDRLADDGRFLLRAALEAAEFPAGDARGQEAFRGFRERINQTAAEADVDLQLELDSRKAPPDQRHGWFTGGDLVDEGIASFTGQAAGRTGIDHPITPEVAELGLSRRTRV
jgi:hypothetical protein